jgi:large subunit ribosomal protein L18
MTKTVLERKNRLRIKRKKRVRGKISGTAEKPRVSIFKSNRYLTAQAIDDTAGNTIVGMNSKSLNLRANIEGATKFGESFAKKLQEKGITTIVFDRNGYKYHGVIAAFADAMRNAGIKF